MEASCLVAKLGSSVLPSPSVLPRVVRELTALVAGGGRAVVVVSAFGDTTDRLLAEARSRHEKLPSAALARFLATGEQAAAASLALALAASGRRVVVAEPAEIGLLADRDGLDADPASVEVDRLLDLFDRAEIVVVPGFYGARPGASVACFGRGGSDLTALVLADALGARCVLFKDVDGLYTEDPNAVRSRALRYESVTFATALRLGGGVVQEKTLRRARKLRRPLEVTSLGAAVRTLVGAGADRLAANALGRRIAPRASIVSPSFPSTSAEVIR